MSSSRANVVERRAIIIHGIVQGVGFRPFVCNLARRLQLGGFVKNQAGELLIEVEGDPTFLDLFLSELAKRPPPLAKINDLSCDHLAPRGEFGFRIEESVEETGGPIFISPDVATCQDCLKELFDPGDRRYGYAFLNCTNCGPRLTIITGTPYDRPRTTMAAFAMCPACRTEYEDPKNRRFHAQPTACPVCGPQLSLLDAHGQHALGDPLTVFATSLRAGKIGALKGLGGYHLACDATNPSAVSELRRKKHRDEKPFALMLFDADAAAEVVDISAGERALLESPSRPIVLLRKRSTTRVAVGVAPGNPNLGIMLPNTPLHHLLLRAMDGIPLVMTSGNQSDEPIAYQDECVVEQLRGIGDVFLVHNRPIHIRCDDSVTRIVDGIELPSRRSRGYAPAPIELPFSCQRPMFAVGGQLKATFALARDWQAFLSHHLGDLDHYEASRAFERDVSLYEGLFAISPEVLIHDLHPDYFSSRYARERAIREGRQLLAVQHHHAHMASCMAENRITGPVIGVCFDGTGFGSDGAIWGGEFLIGDYRNFRRAAHLRYVGMPGGDRVIREPWRMAAAHLLDTGKSLDLLRPRRLPHELNTIEQMSGRKINTPSTSSAGRLFDAVAALVGVRDCVTYEGQAAVELEAIATEELADRSYPYTLCQPAATDVNGPLIVDTRPLIWAVADEASKGVAAGRIARRFHSTLVELIANVCQQLRQSSGVETVTLSGGVFLNALLTQEACERLRRDGFRVCRHRLVPPNDGGLSLGQLAIAAATLNQARE
jgi:hydrogenase maturation protein HypF